MKLHPLALLLGAIIFLALGWYARYKYDGFMDAERVFEQPDIEPAPADLIIGTSVSNYTRSTKKDDAARAIHSANKTIDRITSNYFKLNKDGTPRKPRSDKGKKRK